MSGDEVAFAGAAMSAVVQAVKVVSEALGEQPVVIGGLAVLCRLEVPHRATLDLDVVDRALAGRASHLELLRRVEGSEDQEPSAVKLPTVAGEVKVDVLVVNQAEIDHPSDDPGDRLHASSHAWAFDTATPMVISAVGVAGGDEVRLPALVSEPGPLVAMKLQAVMNRGNEKQATDLLDIVRLMLDTRCRPTILDQLSACGAMMAADIDLHVELWFGRRRRETLELVHTVGGTDVGADDLDVVRELLVAAAAR